MSKYAWSCRKILYDFSLVLSRDKRFIIQYIQLVSARHTKQGLAALLSHGVHFTVG